MKDHLLKQVIDRYLKSGDYNGFYFDGSTSIDERSAAVQLVQDGLIQVVADGVDYPNPHIRPWPSRRSVEQQSDSITSLTPESYGVCLYPTPLALKSVRAPAKLKDQPFSLAMAKGRGTLELAYFSFDVLEQYRNDSRYQFDYWDFGVNIGISDKAYLDDSEPDKDKVSLSHIGFAYDLSNYDRSDPDSPVVRRIAAFYGDLAKLTPEHQQRWKSYQVPDQGLSPHPAWWMSQMGEWPDGTGPFEELFGELANINELWTNAFGEALFAQTDRPKDFGWILRPSQREWDEFVSQLDKVLSENIRQDALTAAGAPKQNKAGQNLGSLSRLAAFMEQVKIKKDAADEILKPLRDIRTARQKPAHALRSNITDKTFTHRQVALLEDLNHSLTGIRYWLASHPANKEWKPKHDDLKSYRM